MVLHFVLVLVNPGRGISYFFQVLQDDRRWETPRGKEKMYVPLCERSGGRRDSWGGRVAVMQLETGQVRIEERFADLLGSEHKVCHTSAVPQARNLAALVPAGVSDNTHPHQCVLVHTHTHVFSKAVLLT